MGEGNHGYSGGKKKQEPARGFAAVDAPREPGHRERTQKRIDRAWQSRGGFADAEEFEAEGSAPIIEWGLFEPGLAVEMWCDPVAGFGHVAGDPCVARFIGTDEADGAEIVEVAKVECGEDEDGPRETRG